MSRTFLVVTVFFMMFALPSSWSIVSAQEKGVAPTAPVPSLILNGKKAFISNGGLDGSGFSLLRMAGDVNQPYEAFYSALYSWGRYALVSTPSEADLVFEIRFTVAVYGGEHGPSFAPQINLTIYDAKTRFVLWALVAPVETERRKAPFVRNVNQGIAALIADLKRLCTEAVNSSVVPSP